MVLGTNAGDYGYGRQPEPRGAKAGTTRAGTQLGQDGKFWSSGAGADRGKGWYNEGWPTAAGQNGRGNHWYNEGRPQLRARTAETITGTTRAGTQVQVRTARPWGSIYIGDDT